MLPGKGPSFPDPIVDPSHMERLHSAEEVDVSESLGYVFEVTWRACRKQAIEIRTRCKMILVSELES